MKCFRRIFSCPKIGLIHCDIVGSKKTPSDCPGAVPGCTEYPVTTQPGEKGSTIVNVNTSHSIEKYPEDNTSD
jgi:hypothetical protein